MLQNTTYYLFTKNKRHLSLGKKRCRATTVDRITVLAQGSDYVITPMSFIYIIIPLLKCSNAAIITFNRVIYKYVFIFLHTHCKPYSYGICPWHITDIIYKRWKFDSLKTIPRLFPLLF